MEVSVQDILRSKYKNRIKFDLDKPEVIKTIKVKGRTFGVSNHGKMYYMQGKKIIKTAYPYISTKTNHKELAIRLCDKQVKWHRLLYIAFYGPIPEEMTIDHIDNDSLNNSIYNLQLMSRKENSLKAHPKGVMPSERSLRNLKYYK